MLTPNTLLQNRYLIVRQLGQGGMGAVYEATDQRFNSRVALKQTLVTTEPLRKAFEREARLLNTLQHAALPHVIDYFFEAEGQFLVMQYIPGDDFGQMLRRRGQPFPVEDVLQWADQLLDLLDYLHTHQPPIVHRDIKPENLKLTPRGNVILLDFGLAKGLAEQAAGTTHAPSIVGYTPNYAPLEQIRGTGTDPRSDIYSLAATIYHLLTKRLPPDAVSRAESFVNGQPDPLVPANQIDPTIPIPVAATLHAALGLRRDERPATAAALRDALRMSGAARTLSPHSGSTDPLAGSEHSTEPAGRPTTPQSRQTFMEKQTEAPTVAVGVTYPATRQAEVSQQSASGSGAKMVVGIAAAAIVAILGIAAVLVWLFVFKPTPAPTYAPEPVAQDTPPTTPPRPSGAPPGTPSAGSPQLTASATSVREALGENSYEADMAIDSRPGTAWIEGAEGDGVGEAITVAFYEATAVSRLRVQPGYFKSPQVWAKNNRLARVTVTLSDGRQFEATFADEMREQSIPVGGDPVWTVMITIEEVYYGGDNIDTAVSEIAVDVR